MKLSLGERKKRFDPLLGERCEISKGGPPLPPSSSSSLYFSRTESFRRSLSLAGEMKNGFLSGLLRNFSFEWTYKLSGHPIESRRGVVGISRNSSNENNALWGYSKSIESFLQGIKPFIDCNRISALIGARVI